MADSGGSTSKGPSEAGAKAGPPDTSARDEGDPKVVAAFALGWHVAELNRLDLASAGHDPQPGKLEGLEELSGLDRARILASQIQVGIQATADWSSLKIGHPSSDALHAALHATPFEADKVRDQVRRLHHDLLGSLLAANFAVGKAYRVGRELAETWMVTTASLESLSEPFERGRIRAIADRIDDLTSAFPDRTAQSVRAGLEEWTAWVHHPRFPGNSPGQPSAGAVVHRALGRQAEIWRSLLSGERKADDYLRVDSYLQAASGLLTRTRRLAGTVLQKWGAALLVAVSVAVAAVISVALVANTLSHHYAAQGSATPTTTTIAAATVNTPTTVSAAAPQPASSGKPTSTIPAILGGLSVLGFTWAGVRATLGKAVTAAEGPIWQQELTEAAAYASLRLPYRVAPLGPVQRQQALEFTPKPA